MTSVIKQTLRRAMYLAAGLTLLTQVTLPVGVFASGTSGDSNGSIKIIKDAIPNTSNEIFKFELKKGAELVANHQLEDNGNDNDGWKNSFQENNLSPGAYTVTETDLPGGWKLENIGCSQGSTVTKDIANNKVTISLQSNQSATCTFTNRPVGSIRVVKMVDEGSGYQDDNPSQNGFLWGLDNEAATRAMGSTAADLFTNKKYGVKEGVVSGYEFTGWYFTRDENNDDQHKVNCSYPQKTTLPTDVAVEKNKVTEITLCNKKLLTPKGSLKVTKFVTGGDKACDDFHFTVNGGSPVRFEADCTNVVADLPLDATYSVVEVEANTNGYVTTYSNPGNLLANDCANISITDEVLAFCAISNTYPLPLNKLGGVKFNDANNNGERDNSETEAGLANWTIELFTCDKEGVECTKVDSATTATDGSYSFKDLEGGNFKVCEVQKAGWTQTYPTLPAEFTPDPGDSIFPTASKCWFAPLLGRGYNVTNADFGNYQTPTNPEEPEEPQEPEEPSEEQCVPVLPVLSALVNTRALVQSNNMISGCKFNDANGNNKWDSGEELLSGFNFDLFTCSNNANQIDTGVCEDADHIVSTTSDANGVFAFTGLANGTYMVCETLRDGWTQTYPVDSYGNAACWLVPVNNKDCIVNFGNKAKQPGHVLPATTTTPAKTLANTGSSAIQGLLVGLVMLGAASGITYLSRRKQYLV